ncbi:BH0509 family protein, partial [Listeria monocytogenes]
QERTNRIQKKEWLVYTSKGGNMTIKERKQLIDVIANYTNHTVEYLNKLSDKELEVIYETRVIEDYHN